MKKIDKKSVVVLASDYNLLSFCFAKQLFLKNEPTSKKNYKVEK